MKTRSSKLLRIALMICALCAMCAGAAAEGAATPTDLPAEPVQITAEVSGAEQDRDGIWHLTRSEDGVLGFLWNDAGAESYSLTLQGPDGFVRQQTVSSLSWSILQKDLPAGDYTFEIIARSGGESVGSASLRLKLKAPAAEPEPVPEEPETPAEKPETQPEEPETPAGEPETPLEEPETPAEEPETAQEEPGRPGGGKMPSRPSGGARKSGKGNTDGQGSGLRITPGQALSSTHASGTGFVRTYGAVDPEAGDGEMNVLSLGGEELALRCGENTFTAGVEEDELILVTDGGDDWSLTMDVLKTLNLSGIGRVRMISPDAEIVLDTDLELTGADYGRERSRGFVSADFTLFRCEGGWRLRVEDREYPVETAEREDI